MEHTLSVSDAKLVRDLEAILGKKSKNADQKFVAECLRDILRAVLSMVQHRLCPAK